MDARGIRFCTTNGAIVGYELMVGFPPDENDQKAKSNETRYTGKETEECTEYLVPDDAFVSQLTFHYLQGADFTKMIGAKLDVTQVNNAKSITSQEFGDVGSLNVETFTFEKNSRLVGTVTNESSNQDIWRVVPLKGKAECVPSDYYTKYESMTPPIKLIEDES